MGVQRWVKLAYIRAKYEALSTPVLWTQSLTLTDSEVRPNRPFKAIGDHRPRYRKRMASDMGFYGRPLFLELLGKANKALGIGNL
jgi:hypothetical protein